MNRILLGQRLAFGFEGTCIPENFAALVREYKIGNVILFRRNIENNEQLRRLCRELQSLIIAETGHPAFITIDQEGGMVTRLAPDAVNVPGNMAIAATGRIGDAYTSAAITARQLRGVGVNFNLAPVLDVNSNRRNPVIGVRSFGDDAARVAAACPRGRARICRCGSSLLRQALSRPRRYRGRLSPWPAVHRQAACGA